MAVQLAPAMSVIVKRSALVRAAIDVSSFASVHSHDEHLVVLGPLFDSAAVTTRLDEHGLEYFEDYFDVPHSGGTVPDWCSIILEYRCSTTE